MLAAADNDGRQQHVRLVVGFRLQKSDDGELADIVFGVAHDRLEQLIGDFHFGEVEVEQVRLELALFQRGGVGIIAHHRGELRLL